MLKKFKISELIILASIIALIFLSEYYYIVLDNPMRAIFIGLWPPTMIGLLIYINIKKNQ
jgi:chromate transport protein ChrA